MRLVRRTVLRTVLLIVLLIVPVLLSSCGDDGLRPPPAIDGTWEGEVVLHGELHSIHLELETTRVVEEEGFFGPSSVAYVRGEATVEFGDSTAGYEVGGSHTRIVNLDVGSRYDFLGAFSGGSVIQGSIFDDQPPDHQLADQGQKPLRLERVTGG